VSTAYRVPRRFIPPPNEPPPYGLLAVSLFGHTLFLFLMAVLSAYVSARVDRSKVYVVNLVPSAPAAGSPAPRAVPRLPAEPDVKPPAATPPKPVPERLPPKPEQVEAPRVKETPPPKPETPKLEAPKPASPPEPPPPRPPTEVARAAPPRPDEFALPRRVERESPALETSVARERLIERTPLPPRPPVATTPEPPPVRPPETPRVVEPPAPREAPALPAVATARPGIEPRPLGRPDAGVPTTGSISLDVSDFPFTYYLRQVQAKISERWSPPRATAAGGERTVVMFEIGRDGQIKEPKLERESGNALYDQSALRAVVEASPFPPLPPEFKAPWLRVHFGFEFRPDQG
jgi:TonB family protein